MPIAESSFSFDSGDLLKAAQVAVQTGLQPLRMPLMRERIEILIARGDYASVLDITQRYDLVISEISRESLKELSRQEWKKRQEIGFNF
ncbi:hypothetical protein [Deinococcus fonticola]|uniref:hypothetical protein n=1 Tax=Deinococcus fonticola TaxID=2528713 RepID=UPI001074B450|nr:hypothetical protein [Deinococcus fonticola]